VVNGVGLEAKVTYRFSTVSPLSTGRRSLLRILQLDLVSDGTYKVYLVKIHHDHKDE
jgi:hypothetical protein